MSAGDAARHETARRSAAELGQLAANAQQILALLTHAQYGDEDWDLGMRMALVLENDLTLVLELDPALVDIPIVVTSRVRAHTLVERRRAARMDALTVAVSLTDVLDEAAAVATARARTWRPPEPSGPAHRAGRVSAAAVRLLPPAHRARYREEFLAELLDLAEHGRSPGDQLGHSVWLLVRAWSLRRALATAHPARRVS